jgi:hypothetical protein
MFFFVFVTWGSCLGGGGMGCYDVPKPYSGFCSAVEMRVEDRDMVGCKMEERIRREAKKMRDWRQLIAIIAISPTVDTANIYNKQPQKHMNKANVRKRSEKNSNGQKTIIDYKQNNKITIQFTNKTYE